MSVPPKWEHILCAQLLLAREVQVPPLREPTSLSVQILVQELVLFLNHEPLFFLWSNLGNPNPTGSVTLTQLTAISCIINTVSLSFSGIQDRRAGTPPISLRRPVEGSVRLFFKKPVIMFRTSPISSSHALATRISPSFSTRAPSSPTLWFSPSGKTPQAKVRGVWSYSPRVSNNTQHTTHNTQHTTHNTHYTLHTTHNKQHTTHNTQQTHTHTPHPG